MHLPFYRTLKEQICSINNYFIQLNATLKSLQTSSSGLDTVFLPKIVGNTKFSRALRTWFIPAPWARTGESLNDSLGLPFLPLGLDEELPLNQMILLNSAHLFRWLWNNYQYVPAFLFAIEEINKGSPLLPSLSLVFSLYSLSLWAFCFGCLERLGRSLTATVRHCLTATTRSVALIVNIFSWDWNPFGTLQKPTDKRLMNSWEKYLDSPSMLFSHIWSKEMWKLSIHIPIQFKTDPRKFPGLWEGKGRRGRNT